MNALSQLLSLLSVACLGLFAGAMLTEGCVLVPFWRGLPAREFFAWYGANAPRLVGFFGPVTWAAGLAALAAAVTSLAARQPSRWLAIAAAALVLSAVATFFVYFDRANAGFSAGRPGPAELAAVAALAASLLSLARRA
jgi:hypothetical protein